MKIGFAGLNLPEGKIKYTDDKFIALVEKCKPDKVSPYFAEFVRDGFERSDAIAVAEGKILDLLIYDIEKCETRLQNAGGENEKKLVRKCLALLESETPVCDGNFNEAERALLKPLALLSVTPTIQTPPGEDANIVIKKALAKAGIIFFYTAGKREVHAWPVRKEADIVECAGKIHTDLARGFIRADVAGFDDFMSAHSFNDAKAAGLVKTVGKDYIINEADIIEIRFNV